VGPLLFLFYFVSMFPIYLLRFRKRKIACIPFQSHFALLFAITILRFLRFAKAQNMAEIAGIFLSPFLQVFFEKMASPEFVDLFRGRKVNDGLLMKLKIKLSSVDAVVEDAEDKQFTKPDVKVWLDELKDVVYDAEDVLDEIATKALQRKLDAELGTFGSKVRNPISTSRFVKKVEKRIEELLDKLDFLVKEKANLGLRESVGVGGNPSERLPTTSLIEESSICGRNYDKEAIINSLLSNDASDSEVGVVAIVGMGGIGKTTLAQLAYNDNRVKENFNLKAWVCVSDPFDVFMVIKTILEVVTLSPCNVKDPNQLQIQLKEMLTGKKFLLVLDDVWNKTYDKWEALSNAFKSGAQGSKVIVTTRDFEVARVMHSGATHHIMELSKEDCWSLFAKYAFHDDNPIAYLELEAIGRQIVEKCKGLPLAIKAIGTLLWSKLDVDEWDKVLRSELWDLPIEEIGIIPALRLSYKYLSPHLKRCFAYCSIFPKDYAFKKDELVLLWMAEGFLLQPKNKTMEEVGDDYFLALVSRSLFQKSDHNEYIMHDLVSDLAKFISKQFTLSLVDDCPPEIVSNTRHLSFHENFASFQEAKRLHTILELNLLRGYIYDTQFPLLMTSCLRVLKLTHHVGFIKLPNSIGKLMHLRYLDVSHTSIKRLPNSICKLYNLQTLNLSYCNYLTALPRNTHKLINLLHLDITTTPNMKKMSRHFGRLKNLRTLTQFVVGKHSGCGIGELKKLNLLRGSLHIRNLQNVTSLTDAKDLNLVDKKYLEELLLWWNLLVEDTSERQIVVLKSLQPHSNLKSLSIGGYGGKSFPDWVGQLPSLEKLDLHWCPEVESFTEGGLPSNLNEITIFDCGKLFANRMGWGLQKLQCLRRFIIVDKANAVESFPNEGLLPTSLTHLSISL
jgi:Leucine-rich repeat (LRR) protein